MNIRPKSATTSTSAGALSSNTTTSGPVTKQPQQKMPVGNKKIDMGAAANFGKKSASSVSSNAAGIHSPTHRDTPGEGNNDLIGYSPINNNTMGISSLQESNNSNSTANNNNEVDDLFKTCSPKSERNLNSAAIINDDLDDFNPRAVEQPHNEFGDFTSAFGGGAGLAEAPSAGLTGTTSTTHDDFADFSAFQGSSSSAINSSTLTSSMGGLDGNLLATTATPANDAFDLFNSSPAVNSINATSLGATTATDLLAGLGDLSIHQSMPMGKFCIYFFFFI